MYLEIKDDGTRVVGSARPRWYNSDGEQLSNQELIEKHNIYPVYDPDIDEDYKYLKEKHVDEGTVYDDHAERAVGIVKDNPPDYDSFYQSIKVNKKDKYKEIDNNTLELNYEIREQTEDQVKNNLKDELSNKRGKKETGGFEYEVNGEVYGIHTDRESQSKLIGTYISAKEENFTEKKWKVKDDNFVILTPDQIIEITQKLEQHVQSCYDNEKRIKDLLDNCKGISDLKTVYEDEDKFGLGGPEVEVQEE